jgi:O-antigen/teichoic acid export membrane protein
MIATNSKVLWNTLSQFGGKILAIFASFVVIKIATQFGTEFYGEYVTTYEFLAFFGIIADAGLFAIAVREMAREKKRTEFILGNILSMRLLLIIGVMLLAGICAQFVPSYSPLVKTGIWITAISMGLTIIGGTLSSVLQARMKIHYFSGSLVLGKIILAGLIFWIAHTTLGGNLFLNFLWAGVISNLIFCACVAWFTSREVRITLRWNWDFLRKTLRISLPYGLALILQTLYLRLDILLISLILGAAAVGTYGAATRVMESLLVLGVYFGQAMLPKISSEEKNNNAVEKSLVWASEKLLLLALPVIIGIEVFASEIIRLLSSEAFLSHAGNLGSDTILRLLVPTVFFAFFNQLFSFTLVAKNRQNYLLIVNAVALGLNAGLNLFLLSRFGIIAAALSTVFCEIIVFGLLIREIRSHWRLPFCIPNLLRIVFLNGVILAELLFTPAGNSLLLGVGVVGVTYIGFVWVWKKHFFPPAQTIGAVEDFTDITSS